MTTRLALLAVIGVSLIWASFGLAADIQKGRQVYDLHCIACHGAGGISSDPFAPSFADGDLLYLMDSDLLQRIRDGKDTMPAFRGLLRDEEIRDVISYLRTF
jgi:cytochrome c6